MDKYIILRKIGQGSFGYVLLLRSKMNRKKYVLKKINLRNLNDKDLRATYQEVHLLAVLHHPNIVSYKDAFKTKEDFLYIIMVYCDGGDMYSKIKNQKGIYFSEKQIIQWIIQMCLGLQYLHDKNILHRDLKTQNIFLSKNNIIKIGDFGIAKILADENSMATTVIGTPYYMSPELFLKKSYNHKSDVWALGCCIYEITSLRHAFYANNISSLAKKILRGKLPMIPSHYCFELQELTSNLLRLEPEKRPSVSKILHSSFIEKHAKMFLKTNKTGGLSVLNGAKILKKCYHQKSINRILLNKNKVELKLEGQGLLAKSSQEKAMLNRYESDKFPRTGRDLNGIVISGREIKLDLKKKQNCKKFKPILNLSQTFANETLTLKESTQQSLIKFLPLKIKSSAIFSRTSRLNTNVKIIARKNRKEKIRGQLIRLKSAQKEDQNEKITAVMDILERTAETESFSEFRISSETLSAEITHLQQDCFKDLGQNVLIKALQLVNECSCKKLEIALKNLLGKENYTNCLEKIQQLNYSDDSNFSTKDST